MMEFNEFGGEITVHVSEVFEVGLESQAASTGYTWTLATMPNCLNLLDISYHTSTSPLFGSKGKQVFRFVALQEAKACLDFSLVSPAEPHKAVRKKSYVIVIQEAPTTVADELRQTIGAERFVRTSAEMRCSAGGPLPPYGVPMLVKEDRENCVLMYGIPWGIAKDSEHCILKYGVPVDFGDHGSLKLLRQADSDDIIVVYGVPTPEYGVPALTAAVQQDKVCHVPMPIIEDKDNCVVKYGIPGGIPARAADCVLKYGVPATMVHDPDNCLVKYGAPHGTIEKGDECVLKYGAPLVPIEEDDCIVKYGSPRGEVTTGKECVVKYGVPVKVVESEENCILLYGVPTGIPKPGEHCVLKYGAPVKLQKTKAGGKKGKTRK